MKIITKNNIKFYHKDLLEKHQEIMLEILSVFSNICMENNIPFWLDGGSLLGLARHNGMIPWDDDIDICVPASDYKKLLIILSDYVNKNKDYTLYFTDNDKVSWAEYFGRLDYLYETNVGLLKPVKIDIFPVKQLSQKELNVDFDKVESLHELIHGPQSGCKEEFSYLKIENKKKIFSDYIDNFNREFKNEENTWLVKGHGQYSPIKKVQYNVVFPLARSKFCGIDVYIPNNMQEYLIASYGNNYKKLPNIDKRKPVDYPIVHFKDIETARKICKETCSLEYSSFLKTSKIKKAVVVIKQLGLKKAGRAIMRYINNES